MYLTHVTDKNKCENLYYKIGVKQWLNMKGNVVIQIRIAYLLVFDYFYFPRDMVQYLVSWLKA